MKCPHCNAEIDNDSKFCPECGKEIILETLCPVCGQKNSIKAIFCKSCGHRLKDQPKKAEAPKKEEKPKVESKEDKNKFLFSIISMSSMLLLIVLIFAFSFAPFLKDDFYPASEFTAIGFSMGVLKTSLKELSSTMEYIPVVNAVVVILLLLSVITAGMIMIGISIPKFVSAIKKKEHFDLSKRVTLVFVLYLCLALYCTRFCFNINGALTEQYSGTLILLLVLVPLIYGFNLFTKHYIDGGTTVGQLISRGITRALIYVFALVILFNIGGNRFDFFASMKYPENGHYKNVTTTMATGYMGIFNYIITNASHILNDVKAYLVKACIASGVGLGLELITLGLGLSLLTLPLDGSLNKPTKNIIGLLFGILSGIMLIVVVIFNPVVSNNLNLINYSDEQYALRIQCFLNDGKTIAAIIIAFLVTATFIAALIIESINKNKAKEAIENE